MAEGLPNPVTLNWESEVDAGYLNLTSIDDGDAYFQRVVENPVNGIGDVVLDFNRQGQLLGIEFLDSKAAPPGWRTT